MTNPQREAREKPILFSALMVRAILDGTKTQTRRILKPQPSAGIRLSPFVQSGLEDGHGREIKPSYFPGDLLWVREAWRTEARYDDLPPRDVPSDAIVSFEADYDYEPNDGCRGRYRHARFMPRWASRITLRVTDVRVHRLQDISEEDAKAEGVIQDSDGWFDYEMPSSQCCNNAVASFATLWRSINGPGSWDANPWVAAYTFERERPEQVADE